MNAYIETDVPIPARGCGPGASKSDLRQKLESLQPGHCLTTPTKDEAERKVLAKRINMSVQTVKKTVGHEFTLRQMYGEIDGEITPVVRVWRTA